MSVLLLGCDEGTADPKAEPPPATVEPDLDANNFKVDHPDSFPLLSKVSSKFRAQIGVTLSPKWPVVAWAGKQFRLKKVKDLL